MESPASPMPDPAPSSNISHSHPPAGGLTRRTFLRSGAGAAVAAVSVRASRAQSAGGGMNVAILGAGAQGNALMTAALKSDIAGLNFIAVCDIWENNRQRMARQLSHFGHDVTEYVDFEEMLAKETGLDAVLIATPDFWHAPHSIACLESSQIKGVYCEKMMSNTIEAARSMVEAQQRTGKLLQIGHQRRSNPRYLHARNNLINGHKICGRITHAYAQWNRAVSEPAGVPDRIALDQATLEKYGYENMTEFLNWRWYQKYGGGPISDLGAHQIDLYNWIFDTIPVSVTASGGIDYYPQYEHYDNALIIYEYKTPAWGDKIARAYYQVLTTTSSQGFYEKFMGENGTVAISENPDVNQAYREARAPSWDEFGEEGLLKKKGSSDKVYHKFWQHPKPWHKPSRWLDTGKVVDVRESAALEEWDLPITLPKPAHTPHLENFFSVVRAGGKQTDLNCPVQDAYKTCVTVLKVNDAIREGRRIEFDPEEFTV